MSHQGIHLPAGGQKPLLSIFPNPCLGDTYLYTDDPCAQTVNLCTADGEILLEEPIIPGRSLHLVLDLTPGTYYLELKDHNLDYLGLPLALHVVK